MFSVHSSAIEPRAATGPRNRENEASLTSAAGACSCATMMLGIPLRPGRGSPQGCRLSSWHRGPTWVRRRGVLVCALPALAPSLRAAVDRRRVGQAARQLCQRRPTQPSSPEPVRLLDQLSPLRSRSAPSPSMDPHQGSARRNWWGEDSPRGILGQSRRRLGSRTADRVGSQDRSRGERLSS